MRERLSVKLGYPPAERGRKVYNPNPKRSLCDCMCVCVRVMCWNGKYHRICVGCVGHSWLYWPFKKRQRCLLCTICCIWYGIRIACRQTLVVDICIPSRSCVYDELLQHGQDNNLATDEGQCSLVLQSIEHRAAASTTAQVRGRSKRSVSRFQTQMDFHNQVTDRWIRNIIF